MDLKQNNSHFSTSLDHDSFDDYDNHILSMSMTFANTIIINFLR